VRNAHRGLFSFDAAREMTWMFVAAWSVPPGVDVSHRSVANGWK